MLASFFLKKKLEWSVSLLSKKKAIARFIQAKQQQQQQQKPGISFGMS